MQALKLHSLCLVMLLAVIPNSGLSKPFPIEASFSIVHGKSTITFINKSGVPALVKLSGPTRHNVDMGNGGSKTVHVAGGSYYILVRYGAPGKYSYSKGDPFTVHETATGYEAITITLHTVAGGNYDSRPSSPAEFERG